MPPTKEQREARRSKRRRAREKKLLDAAQRRALAREGNHNVLIALASR